MLVYLKHFIMMRKSPELFKLFESLLLFASNDGDGGDGPINTLDNSRSYLKLKNCAEFS